MHREKKSDTSFSKNSKCTCPATSYFFHSLNYDEEAYDTTHRDCFAIEWAVHLVTLQLEDPTFTVCTYHDALHWILIMTDSAGDLTTFPLHLLKFELDFVPRTGTRNQAAHVLF